MSFYIDNKVYTDAPEKCDTEFEYKCFEFLNEHKIPFLRAAHDSADTIEICLDIEKVIGCPICKNLFLCNRRETDFYLLLMPGDKPFKTKYLSSQIGASRLSFASPKHMEDILNVSPGSVTVLSLISDSAKDVTLLIDEELLENEYIGCHPCINTSTLKIKTEDIISDFLPAVKHGYKTVSLPRQFE